MPGTVARRSALALGAASAACLPFGRGRAAEQPVLKIGVLTGLEGMYSEAAGHGSVIADGIIRPVSPDRAFARS